MVGINDNQALKKFIDGKRNINTVKATETSHIRLKEWLESKGIHEEIDKIEPSRLDKYIGHYVLEMKKPDGSNYQPDSITAWHRGVERFLKEKDYDCSLITSPDFEMSRKVIESQRKTLKESGLGNGPNKSECLTEEEEELLWSTGQLGDHSPESLLNTVWVFNTKLLGFRGNHENKQRKWGDLALKSDEYGRFLEFNERLSKTRDGSNVHGHIRAFALKMYENVEAPPHRCPVRIWENYMRRRPVEMLDPNSDFYIAINHAQKSDDFIWYKRSALGINTIMGMMKKMAAKAGIQGRKTNHSLRKTMCTRLVEAGVHPNTVAQLSGHKNVASKNNYCIASKKQQVAMSKILSLPEGERPSSLPSAATGHRPVPALPHPRPAKDPSASAVAVPETQMQMNSKQTMLRGMFAGATLNNCQLCFNFDPSPTKAPCVSIDIDSAAGMVSGALPEAEPN